MGLIRKLGRNCSVENTFPGLTTTLSPFCHSEQSRDTQSKKIQTPDWKKEIFLRRKNVEKSFRNFSAMRTKNFVSGQSMSFFNAPHHETFPILENCKSIM